MLDHVALHVKLQNVATGEFLYTANENVDDNHRAVYTSNEPNKTNKAYKWLIYGFNQPGGKFVVQLLNQQFMGDTLMCWPEKNYSNANGTHSVYTLAGKVGTPATVGEWDMEPVVKAPGPAKSIRYRFRDTLTNEHMYVEIYQTNSSSTKRRVLSKEIIAENITLDSSFMWDVIETTSS